MYNQGNNPRYQPFVDNHTNHHGMLRHQVHMAIANGDYQYASIASQLLHTNYDDFFIEY